MIGVFVSFNYGEEFDRSRIEKVARDEHSIFRGMPGLRFKCFTVDDAARKATNFYVWESKEAADRFFSDEVRERVISLYGVRPQIGFVDVLEVVDNWAMAPTP